MLLLFSITQRPIEKAVIFLGRRGVGGGGWEVFFFIVFEVMYISKNSKSFNNEQKVNYSKEINYMI